MNLMQMWKIDYNPYIIKKLQILSNKLKNTISKSYIDLYCNQKSFDDYLEHWHRIKKLKNIDTSAILRDNPYYYHGLSWVTNDNMISKKDQKIIKKRIKNLEFYIQNYDLYKNNYFLLRDYSYNIKIITIKKLNLLINEYENYIIRVVNNKDNI